ncbi:MAG: YtxH domain-containing protein [Methylococcales bacterium]|nr:YtxH domain-containing protein [Methylococcales bacterium]
MSNDENSKETVNEMADKAEEMLDDAVDQAEEMIDDAVETVSETAESAGSKITALKESNPKLFYGGIGAIILLLLILMMSSGGSTKPLPQAKVVGLSVGQTYSLKGVNTYDPDATVRLVAVPGSMAAYDETKENGEKEVCKHMPQGTTVKLIQIQEAFGKAKFVEVEMTDGDCAGKKGWTISNNLN